MAMTITCDKCGKSAKLDYKNKDITVSIFAEVEGKYYSITAEPIAGEQPAYCKQCWQGVAKGLKVV